MNTNTVKLIIVGVITVVLVVVIAIDSDNADWAVPLLGILIGYVVGNAQLSSREGNVAPIVSLDETSA